jgi:hypothetical protein
MQGLEEMIYKVKVSAEEADKISAGNVAILLAKLKEVDNLVVRDLKKHRGDDTAFLQGISGIVDELTSILKRNA